MHVHHRVRRAQAGRDDHNAFDANERAKKKCQASSETKDCARRGKGGGGVEE